MMPVSPTSRGTLKLRKKKEYHLKIGGVSIEVVKEKRWVFERSLEVEKKNTFGTKYGSSALTKVPEIENQWHTPYSMNRHSNLTLNSIQSYN